MHLKNNNDLQLNYYNSKFKRQKIPIVIVADRLVSHENIGGLFRISDAFWVSKIYFGGSQEKFKKKVFNVSRSTEKVVDYEHINDTFALVKEFKAKKRKIIGIEITKNSNPISKVKFDKDDYFVLIFGNERNGISYDLLNLCDDIYHIEMFGQNSSMNVIQAASIALYEITKKI